MSPVVKRRVNAGYLWLEQNPVTGVLLSVGVSVAVTIAAVGALGIFSVTTFQEKTACSQDPDGSKCAELRLDVAEGEPLRNQCVPYQRVTSRRGRNCPRFYVDPGPMGAVGPAPSSSRSVQGSGDGGVGQAPASTQPGGEGVGVGPGSDGGGKKTPGHGGEPPTTNPPAPSPPTATEPPAETASPPASSNILKPTLEGVQKGAGEVVGGVGGTLDQTGCAVLGACGR